MVTAVSKTPQSLSYGKGEDSLVLKISQDYYLADAQYVVLVDGVQVGGVFTASATRASGQYDTLTLHGDWGGGAHSIQVSFLNDAGGDLSKGEDRNLFVMGGSYNGVDFASGRTSLWSKSTASFAVEAAADAYADQGTVKYATAARDTFVIGTASSHSTISGFTVSGANADVVRLEALHLSGFQGILNRTRQVGNDAVITLNDDVILRLKGVAVSSLTAANFKIVNLVTNPEAIHQEAGTGADTLELKITQRYHSDGNALFTVSVDGKQVGGTYSASALHLTGQQDTLTLHGDWGSGDHVVSVTFLNDANNLELGEDRNLYVEGATINGVVITDAVKALYSNGSAQFVASIAAAIPPAAAPGAAAPAKPVPVVIADTTHDIFDYARGEGAKTFDDFSATGEGSDVIRLGDYGYVNHALAAGLVSYAGFSDILSQISQQGADAVIKLSDTDSITLKNVDASTLGAGNFSFLSEIAGAMEADTNNGWIVFNNTWGSSDLTDGKDYTISASYDSEAMASGATFTWSYPPPSVSWTKIMGYPSLMFGSDTYDNVQGDHDPAQVLPVQIANLDKIVSTYDISYGGETAGFDVAYDIWMTNVPNGKWDNVTNEVMIWLHQGDVSAYGTLIGTYDDGSYSAKIYHVGTYTALVPDKDYTSGSIDITDVLSKLKGLGIISDSEYVNQIDLGAEPIKGSGYLTINGLTYDIENREDGGIVKTSHADGGVTSVTLTGTAGKDVLNAETAKIATLIGGAGDDVFVFNKGVGGAVTVQDFHSAAAGGTEHDLLKFVAYGTDATLTHESNDLWAITYQGGVDHISLQGITSLSATDYVFM